MTLLTEQQTNHAKRLINEALANHPTGQQVEEYIRSANEVLTKHLESKINSWLAKKVNSPDDVHDQILNLQEKLKAAYSEIDALKLTVDDQNRRIIALESKDSTLTNSESPKTSSFQPISFANILKKNSAERCELLNGVTAEKKDKERRANRVIVSGLFSEDTNSLPVSNEDDTNLMKNLFIDIGMDPSKIINARRIPVSKRIVNEKSAKQLPSQTLDELSGAEDREKLLSKAHTLGKIEKYSNTFIRPDRTESEQAAFREECSKKNAFNDILKSKNLFNNPFRFVLRRDRDKLERTKCIDTSKKDKYDRPAYVSEEDLKKILTVSNLS